MNAIETAARASLKPKDRRPPWQWIEENVGIRNSPFGNRPNFSRTPWLKEPSEVFADNRRHIIDLQCCVQGAKSFFLQTHGIWALAEDPGPLGIYVQTNEFVTKLARGRWLPMIEETPALQKLLRPNDRFAVGKAEIYFKHTFAYVMAANESNTQTISLRYVFCDDVFVWSAGMLAEAHKRATQWWNRRIINASTPGDVDSDMDKSFEAGDQRERRMMCPHCRRVQLPEFEKHIKWPTNDVTKPDGKWNFEQVKKAARFICEFCKAAIPHTEETARTMNDNGDYLVTNPNAPFDHVSFRWNALVLSPSVLSWGDLAVEFIQAARAWKAGHHLPMKEFKTKREALSWNPRTINPFADLPVIEMSSSLPEKKFWPLQDFIAMGVDVQIDHFWVLVMAWSLKGDECAIHAAQVYNWSDVAEVQTRFFVADEDVCVDWSHRPNEVVQECARHGHFVARGRQRFWLSWKALRGSEEFQFIYKNQRTGQKIPLPYSWPPAHGDPTVGLRSDDPRRREFSGKFCPIITWSNPSIKDIVTARRDGRVDVKVETLKGDWNKEYFRQCNSQKKVQVQPRYGSARWKYENFTDDHLMDCRCMITVRAIQKGLIGDVASAQRETE